MPVTTYPKNRVFSSAPVSPALALAAILLVSLTLRAPIASLPPLISFVVATLHLTPAQAGLLTSIPVLAMAVLTVAASALIKRFGITNAMTVSLLCLIAGQLIRSAPAFVFAIIGTALIGTGIAIGNVAIPMLIARDYQHRSATMSGLYSATMNVGSAIATILVVPLAYRIGWQVAAALWTIVGLAALAVWRFRWRGTPSVVAPDMPGAEPAVVTKTPLGATFAILTALLCIVYIGQSSSYYAITAWLPQILTFRLGIDRAAAAGMAMPFQLLALVGALAVPALLARGLNIRVIAMIFSFCWMSLPLGLLLLPDLALGWILLSGMAHGGCFTVMLTLLTQRAPSPDAARRASTIVLTVGYIAAAIAPTLYGVLFQHTQHWTLPLVITLGVLALMSIALWFAAARRLASLGELSESS